MATLRSRYRSVLRGLDGRPRAWLGVLGVLAGATAALAVGSRMSRYDADVVTTLLLFVALAQAWNILAGLGGQICLGVGAFAGTGAYATGLLMLHTGMPPVSAIAGGTVAAGLLAGALSMPLLRLRGGYFAVGSMAAALALQAWMVNWAFGGGSNGLSLPVGQVPDGKGLYRLAVAVAGVTVAAALMVQRSRFGLRLAAVRDDEPAATGLGVSAFRHRLAALVISGLLTGLVGSVVALQKISFEPGGMLGIGWTVNALLMTVVGGIGTLIGPALGAAVVYYVLTSRLDGYPTLGLVVEGLLLILVVRFAPHGLWPLLTRAPRGLTSGAVGIWRARRAEHLKGSSALSPVWRAECSSTSLTTTSGTSPSISR